AECAVSCSKSVAWESRKTNGVKPRIREIAFPKIWYPIPGIWLFTFIEKKKKRRKKKRCTNLNYSKMSSYQALFYLQPYETFC
ncbi:unnamed protein product, partial [Gulo gulo]